MVQQLCSFTPSGKCDTWQDRTTSRTRRWNGVTHGKCLEQSPVEEVSNIISFVCLCFQSEHLSQDMGKKWTLSSIAPNCPVPWRCTQCCPQTPGTAGRQREPVLSWLQQNSIAQLPSVWEMAKGRHGETAALPASRAPKRQIFPKARPGAEAFMGRKMQHLPVFLGLSGGLAHSCGPGSSTQTPCPS